MPLSSLSTPCPWRSRSAPCPWSSLSTPCPWSSRARTGHPFSGAHKTHLPCSLRTIDRSTSALYTCGSGLRHFNVPSGRQRLGSLSESLRTPCSCCLARPHPSLRSAQACAYGMRSACQIKPPSPVTTCAQFNRPIRPLRSSRAGLPRLTRVAPIGRHQ